MEWEAGRETVCAKVLSEDSQVCFRPRAVKRNMSCLGQKSAGHNLCGSDLILTLQEVCFLLLFLHEAVHQSAKSFPKLRSGLACLA